MMDFISVPLVVGIVCAGIYGLFELFVRKRERLAIIEKIGDKLDASAFDGKLGLPNYMRNFSFSSLKAGCLLAGIGLGLLVGFIINIYYSGRIVIDEPNKKARQGIRTEEPPVRAVGKEEERAATAEVAARAKK